MILTPHILEGILHSDGVLVHQEMTTHHMRIPFMIPRHTLTSPSMLFRSMVPKLNPALPASIQVQLGGIATIAHAISFFGKATYLTKPIIYRDHQHIKLHLPPNGRANLPDHEREMTSH